MAPGEQGETVLDLLDRGQRVVRLLEVLLGPGDDHRQDRQQGGSAFGVAVGDVPGGVFGALDEAGVAQGLELGVKLAALQPGDLGRQLAVPQRRAGESQHDPHVPARGDHGEGLGDPGDVGVSVRGQSGDGHGRNSWVGKETSRADQRLGAAL